MARKNSKRSRLKTLSFAQRFVLFGLGLAGLVMLYLYAFSVHDDAFQIVVLGRNITQIVFAIAAVFTGIIFSTLLKTGMRGKLEWDS